MNPLSSELPFHVHNWLIISLKDFCIVIRKWPTFWPSRSHEYSMLELIFNKSDSFFWGEPQENDTKFRFATKCQTVATLAPVYRNPMKPIWWFTHDQ